MLVYPAIFHQEDDAVWAEFPDLPGCQTFGDNVEECILSAQEALGAYAESVIERDIKLAESSDVRSLKTDDANSFVMPIYCDLKNYSKDTKAVKKTLTIPQWLNDRAMKYNINFSETLQNALIEKLCK
jgi:predicted RNase H-like HicB family nuclease